MLQSRLQASIWYLVLLTCLKPLICSPYVVSISYGFIEIILSHGSCVLLPVSLAGPSQKLESITTHFLKKWINLPQSATHAHVVLYYPGICYPSISHVTREAILSLLACTALRERKLTLHLTMLYFCHTLQEAR